MRQEPIGGLERRTASSKVRKCCFLFLPTLFVIVCYCSTCLFQDLHFLKMFVFFFVRPGFAFDFLLIVHFSA